ncbi:DUF4129 domain-containing protein [Pseudomonas stutzeri]|uniref:DUF4129 domain-containing protein n=1 Tax=Stutzerimonas stutzeri TaxID=316 RepID=A0A2N8SLZ5_STUST|nr:DUF4129 domain-containing protein [Stutzerimonas stutzeri]MCQ4249394.1 DUF4129 domain-containing protein [Stutzerimonas stutzeri]PNG03493.1 DUF4129 domain-containing protein [Stutzerimonas stutzeri]
MQLNDATLEIRPRSAWEAIDLGALLARRHARLLMLSWALLTLPVFVLLSLLFWSHPSLALLLFWWLKPLYERLPLFILSRSLFGDIPTLQQSFRALPGLLRRQWFASLTWRRFSLTRSFDLPVMQLEELSGPTRKQRLRVLQQRDARAARWLTIVGVHLESGLWLGALALIYLMIPAPLIADLSWMDLLRLDQDWLWFEHLSNLLYALVLVFWEPIYVASGFSLYLNRRTTLEAWDIELSFRRLQERLRSVQPVLLLGIALLLAMPAQPTQAAPAMTPSDEHSATVDTGAGTESLDNQPLTRQAARERIGGLLNEPPFRHQETITRWRLGDEQTEAAPGWLARLLDRWLRLHHDFDHIVAGIEVALWAGLFGLIALVLWRYRQWLRLHVGRPQRALQPAQDPPAVLFGLDVQPENLPLDVAGEVERLWDEQPREALGLLYRAFLSRLLHERKVPLKAAHTEGEILELLRQAQQPELTGYAEALTGHWLNLAYGHRLPASDTRRELCDGWRDLFAVRGRA